MISVLKKAIGMKTKFLRQLLVFLAVFILLVGEYAATFYLAVAKMILPGYASAFFQILGYLLGGILLYYGMRKTGKAIPEDQVSIEDETESPDDAEPVPKKQKKGPGAKRKKGLMAFIMNFLMIAVVARLIQFSFPSLLQPSASRGFVTGLAFTLFCLVFLEIFIVTAWLISNNSASHGQYFRFFLKSLSLYFKGMRFNIVSSLTIVFVSGFMVFLHLVFWPILFSTSLTPLLIIVYETATYGCLIGWTLITMMKIADAVYEGKSQYVTDKKSPIGYAMVLVFLAGLVYISLPGANSIEAEFDRLLAGAEEYRGEGQLYLCGNEYKKAYALMKAYNGFLLETKTLNDKDASDEEIRISRDEANALFKEAYAFYPGGGKIYYLEALRFKDKNPHRALTLALKAKEYDPGSAEAHLLILDLGRRANNQDLVNSVAGDMVEKGIHPDSGSLDSMSSRKIDAALDSIDDHVRVCMENLTAMAYDYYNNQLYPEAMEELVMIKEVLPLDIVTNYLIAMTDLELKSDNKAYTTAIEAAQTILDQYPDEKWAQDLYSGVVLRAGNQDVMDATIKEAYDKNPANPEMAEQYAYSLLKKNYSSSYYEVTQEAETVVDRILAKDGNRWFALFCKSLIELYKGEYESSLDHMNQFSDLIVEDPDLFSIHDELYNTYVVKYARRMVLDGAAREVLSKDDSTDAFTYSYIMGAYGTMSREIGIQATIDHLIQALDYNPGFSKPYYMIGNAYMEDGHRNKHPESFELAEDYYKESIHIFNDDPYAWFALGHAYKKQERYEEAMGAFRKTLTLMPAQDHQSDHFGISIHSTYQIRELEKMLAEKEGQ